MIFQPGKNCWRIERSSRVAFLVDGAAYFAALRRAFIAARRSIVMVGWDFDSTVRLSPEPTPRDGFPSALLPFLNALCDCHRGLSIHVLAWDFSLIYAFEREPLPAMQFAWRGHRRIHFELDGEHPAGASHHQKIVVVDDKVAFVGGVDLTSARWDTPAHHPGDLRRVDGHEVITRPMHDVQVAVDGATAAGLGDLVRARWKAATGESLGRCQPLPTDPDPWPNDLPADVTNTDVAIARTSAASRGQPEVREIETLTLQAIADAKRTIYVENQYLTSSSVGAALAGSLERPDGPDVVLVLPKDQGGWLEESSMGVLRGRLLQQLRSSDRHGRLRIDYPVVPGLPGDQCLGVHSKVLIVDDTFVKIGSANLSNRSMGLDTECDLVLSSDAPAGDKARAIAGLRSRLLSEHLGVEPSAFERCVTETGSVARAIDALAGGARTLAPLAPAPEPAVHLAVLDGLVCDPERPVGPERLIEQLVPPALRRPVTRSLSSYGALLVAVLVVAAAWRFTPLGDLLVVERLVALGRLLRESPFAPLYVVAAYLVGTLLFFPVTLLVTGTTLVFDPLQGFFYCVLGTLSAACSTYGMGRLVGRPLLERFLDARLRRFRMQLRRRSFAAILGARLVPVANFSLVNVLAGALQVRFRPYIVANVIGILPGITAFVLFADRLGSTLAHPRLGNFLSLFASLVIIVGALAFLRRGLRRASRPVAVPPLDQANEV